MGGVESDVCDSTGSHSVHPNIQVRALLEANSAITVEENKAVRRSRSPDRRGGWERMESG